MNESDGIKIEHENPWKHFSEPERPSGQTLSLAALLYLVSCIALPLSLFYVWVALAAWAVLLAGSFYLSRHAVSGAVTTLVVSLLCCLFAGVAPAFGAASAALCVGIMAGSFLQTCTRKFYFIGILSAVAYGIAFVSLGNQWDLAVPALFLIPAVLLLSVATNLGEYRTTAICYAAVGLLIAMAGGILLWGWRSYGSVALGVWKTLLQSLEDEMVQMQIGFRDAYAAQIHELLSLNPSADQIASADRLLEQLMAVMSDENLRATAQSVIGLLPAAMGLLCMLPAFLAQKMLNGAYASNGMRSVLTPESEFFTMSLPAAVLFVLSAFCTLAVPVTSVFVTVVSNLSLLLFPGFFLLGIRALRFKFAGVPRPMRTTLILAAVFLLCCSTVSALLLVALFGAYERVLSAIQRRLAKKLGGRNDSHDQGNDSL